MAIELTEWLKTWLLCPHVVHSVIQLQLKLTKDRRLIDQFW